MPENAIPVLPVNKKGNIILLYVISSIVILIGIALIAITLLTASPLETAAGLTAEELDTSKNYYFSELYIIDTYAYYEYDEDNMFLNVAFFDGDDNLRIASLSPQKDAALLDKIWGYFNDETAYLGDLAISAAVDVSGISSLEQDIEGYYNETLPEVEEMFRSSGLEATGTTLHLDYLGADQTAYDKYQQNEKTTSIIVGGVICLVGVLLMIFSPRIIRKRWAQMEAQAMNASVVNIQTPQSVVNVGIPLPTAPAAPAPEEEA